VVTTGIALFFAIFLLWPLADTLLRAFIVYTPDGAKPTLLYLAELFRNPVERDAILLSFWIAIWSTIVTFIIALPMAWIFARKRFFGKSFLSALLLAPLIMPPFVGAVGMKWLFARGGAVNGILAHFGIEAFDWFGSFPLAGIIILQALHLYPILYLNLTASLANVDPTLESAAANLGASPWRVFWRVTLPLSMPGAFAGGVLVLVWAFTELGTPLIFGMRGVLPVRLFNNVSEASTNPIGPAQTAFVLLITAFGYLIAKWAMKKAGDMATAGRLGSAESETQLSRGGTLVAWLAVGFVIGLATLPHLSVGVMAFASKWSGTILPTEWTLEYFDRSLSSPVVQTALKNSLMLSILACILDGFIGCGIAWLCVRKKARGSWLLDALAMLPLAAPGIVVAFGYLAAFGGGRVGRWLLSGFGIVGWEGEGAEAWASYLGSFLDPRQNPLPLLMISYAVRRLPYMTRAAYAGLEQVSKTYEEAASNLGASPWRVWRRVTLPLISANLLAGGILTFIFSMLEVSDSLILAQGEASYPLTKAFYSFIGGLQNGNHLAAALGVWTMAILGCGIALAAILMGKSLGRLFRAGN